MSTEQSEHNEPSSGHLPSSPASGISPFDASIRGRHVIAADGQDVGQISDLMVAIETWRVDSVRLKLNNSIADRLGVRRGKFHPGILDLPVQMIQSVGDSVVLSVPTAELRPKISGPNDAAA